MSSARLVAAIAGRLRTSSSSTGVPAWATSKASFSERGPAPSRECCEDPATLIASEGSVLPK
eukprot:583924-Prymnesium_polylepis.1